MKRLVPIFRLLCLPVFVLNLIPLDLARAGFTHFPPEQATTSALISEVNALRQGNGLPVYTVNAVLMGTAQGQANYMAATGQITHTGPGGINLTQRLLNAGYPLAGDLSLGGFRAENITGGPNKSAAQAVQEWTGDAPHLNTMLSPNLTEIGAGVAMVGDMVYLVIDCARPTTGGIPQPYTPGPGEVDIGTSAPSDFIVPVVTSTPDMGGLVFHDVQYGQTLWAIAIAYGVKIEQIQALNNLSGEDAIYQGDRLLIREDPKPVHEAATTTSVPASAAPEKPPTSIVAVTESPIPTAVIKVTPVDENLPVLWIASGIVLAALTLAVLLTLASARKPD